MIHLEYYFETDVPPIPNSLLDQLADELQIKQFELYTTHWAIKGAELFRTLLNHRVRSQPSPTVFSLNPDNRIEDRLVSVMMPFDLSFDAVFSTIQHVCRENNLECLRADDIWENAKILEDIVSLINRSRVIVCDCTGRNPNVFYEIGIAHTIGREVIVITQSVADIPFDLSALRHIHYLNNVEGRDVLAEKLSNRLRTLLSEDEPLWTRKSLGKR